MTDEQPAAPAEGEFPERITPRIGPDEPGGSGDAPAAEAPAEEAAPAEAPPEGEPPAQ